MPRSRSLAALAILGGALCLATGLSYFGVRPTQLTISALVTLGIVGCGILVVAGVWQAATTGERRRSAVAALGLAGLGFVAASVLGFAGSRVAHTARLEPTGLQTALHAAGVGLGTLLCVWVVLELLRVGADPRARAAQPQNR